MKKRTKYLISSLVAIFGAISFAGFAKASDISAQNSFTGAGSENSTEVLLDNSQSVDISNDADVHNDINIVANTGGNSASWNTGGGSIKTGDADVQVSAATEVNSVSLESSGFGFGDSDIELGNDTTGACSENEVSAEIINESEIDIDNDADIDNDIDIEAETGDNEVEGNVGGGFIETGDADVEVEVLNEANNTAVDFGGFGGDTDVELINEFTGFGSENEIEFALDNRRRIDIDNDADIKNDIDIEAETGDNEAEHNGWGEAVIETGDAEVEVNLENMVNSTTVDLSGIGDDIDVELVNEKTGAESENEIEFDLENCTELDIDNDADIDNDIDIEAETGENEAEENGFGAEIETGDVEIEFDIVNEANLVDLALGGGSDIEIEAANECTGFGSENEIEVDIDNSRKIDIDNDADIDNDIDIEASTGHNEVEGNGCGESEIETGDVEIEGSLETVANVVELCEEGFGDEISVEAINETTGAESENEIELELENSSDLDVENDLDKDTDVEISAETGCNEAEENIGGGFVGSGDAEIDLIADTAGDLVGGGDIDTFTDGGFDTFDTDLSGEGNLQVNVNGDDVV